MIPCVNRTPIVIVNIRYNVMCTNDGNPHLIDNKMYLSYVKCHVRGVVAYLVVRYGDTNNKPTMCGNGNMQAISFNDTEKACCYCQREAPRKLLGPRALERLKNPPLEHERTLLISFIFVL